MKKILSIIAILFIFTSASWEVNLNSKLFVNQHFSANISNQIENNIQNNIQNNVKNNVQNNVQNNNLQKKINQENLKSKIIFKKTPKTNEKIIKKFLEKFKNKNFFLSLKKISWASSKNRGLAWASKIYFNFDKIDNNQEFKRVMIHEMWHVFDLWFLNSNEKKIASNFKDWTKTVYADDPSVEFYSLCFSNENTKNWKCKTKDFPSKYWQTDPFEDFAESFLLFIENNSSFKEMWKESNIMQKKYNFIEKYLWKIDSGKYYWQEDKKRVRDMTLAY